MSQYVVAKILAVTILSVGLLVTIGWFFEIDNLKTGLPGATTVKFSAAISFIFTGLAILFIIQMRHGKAGLAQIGLPTSALIIIMFITVNTVTVLIGGQISLSSLFEERRLSSNIEPVRLPIGAMVNFSLISLAIIGSFIEFTKTRKMLIWIGCTVGTIGALALVGYAANTPVLYYEFEGVSNAMAIHGAATFVLIGIALVILGKNKSQAAYTKTVLIRTKLMSLFLTISIIPITFLGIITYMLIREFEIIHSFGYSFIIIGTVTTLAAAVFAYFITRQITKPLDRLRGTALSIAQGNLNVKANEEVMDEIGELAKTFNQMIDGIKKTTELEQETERLHQIDKDKEEFAAMVSHELKTPLIPISGYAELFLDGSLGEITPTQKEKIQIMYENSIRLTTLIQDILDVRKIELGKLKLDIQDESIKQIVRRSIDIFRPISEQKCVTLIDDTHDTIVKCDPDRILQILNNLISNAIKFVPTKIGTISINSRITDNNIVIGVLDNGPGIPKTKQGDLFRKFYQVDKTLTRKSGGTGLGLAISKGIIDSHGGKIWIESEGNTGTCVYFTLPLEKHK